MCVCAEEKQNVSQQLERMSGRWLQTHDDTQLTKRHLAVKEREVAEKSDWLFSLLNGNTNQDFIDLVIYREQWEYEY